MNKKRGKSKEAKKKEYSADIKPVKQLTTPAQSSKIDALIGNTASLQKIILGLARDIHSLSRDISKMLELFDEASKAFKEGRVKTEGGVSEERIDQLLEQNKVIAKGLVLLERFLREQSEEKPKPLPEY